MAKQIVQGGQLRLRHRHGEPRALHVGVPQPPVAERRRTSTRRPQARRRVAEPAAVEVADFWAGARRATLKIAPPANASCRDAFIAGKLGMWIAGSWNFTGLREAKVDFAVAPGAAPLQAAGGVDDAPPVHAPEAEERGPRQARRGVDARPVDDRSRGGVDAQGRAGLGLARSPTPIPRITGDPVLERLLAQAPNWQAGQPTPKWVAAENLTRPVIESVYTAQKPGKAAMEDLARQINALPD